MSRFHIVKDAEDGGLETLKSFDSYTEAARACENLVRRTRLDYYVVGKGVPVKISHDPIPALLDGKAGTISIIRMSREPKGGDSFVNSDGLLVAERPPTYEELTIEATFYPVIE